MEAEAVVDEEEVEEAGSSPVPVFLFETLPEFDKPEPDDVAWGEEEDVVIVDPLEEEVVTGEGGCLGGEANRWAG